MSKNPSAFPFVASDETEFVELGMTLRDWFAGQALTAIITAAAADDLIVNPGETNDQAIARYCFCIADAMLAERSK